MPQGPISDIELRKQALGLGEPLILWKIEVAAAGGEKGAVLADTAGALKQTLLPESRRKPSDWFDPETMIDPFARIDRELGAGAKVVQLSFSDDKVMIVAPDPLRPGALGEFYLSDKGFERSAGTPVMAGMSRGVHPFTIAELAPLSAARIADLKAKTLARMNLRGVQVTDITIGRGNMDPSPKGNITVEIRALVPPFNAPIPPGGRVVYELDGTVIKYYLP